MQQEKELKVVQQFMEVLLRQGVALCKFDHELKAYIPINETPTELFYEQKPLYSRSY